MLPTALSGGHNPYGAFTEGHRRPSGTRTPLFCGQEQVLRARTADLRRRQDPSLVTARVKVMSVVGTRPNFMKMAPVIRELERRVGVFEHVLVHTEQHYDDSMWRVFVEELQLPEPDHYLGVGSGSHGEQISRTIERLEPVIAEEEPDVVLVPGDVNSTLGAALAAATRHVPVGHVEAGLRNFDPAMPEELNRRLVDQLSRFLFIHSPEAHDNL